MIKDLQSLMEEYKPNKGIWNEDDELIDGIKNAVNNLKDADRIIFILYCETGSLREVGKMLGVSHTTVFKCIKEIKKKILTHIGYDLLKSE